MTPSRHSTVAAGWGRNPFLDPDSPASAAARMAAEIGDRHNLESHTTAAHDAWGRPWVAVEFAARYAVCCPSQTVKPGWVGLRPSPHDGSPYHDGTGDAQCPGCGSRGVGLAMSGAAVLDPGDLRSQLETLAAAALRRAAEAQL